MATYDSPPEESETKKSPLFENRISRKPALQDFQEREHEGKIYKVIKTPNFLSLTRGKLERIQCSVEFLNVLERCLKQHDRVMLDMSHLTGFSTDATLAIRSQYREGKDGAAIIPKRISVAKKLYGCGFFTKKETEELDEALESDNGTVEDLANGKITHNSGPSWSKHANPEIDPEKARELVLFATKRLYGQEREFSAVYGMLTEMMSNTIQHAAESSNAEVWWASVHYDRTSNSVRFNFLDNGIGILKRIRLAWGKKYGDEPFRWATNTQLLKAVLAGEVPCLKLDSDGGAGLPDLAKRFDGKVVRNLVVLCNDSIGRKKENEYGNINEEFSGTLIHWEIGREHRKHTRDKSG